MSADPTTKDENETVLRDHFTKILVMDVDAASIRFKANDTQPTRRDLIRSIFAAVEGMGWSYRTFIVEAATAMDHLTSAERIVLSERINIVTAAGKVQEQERFIPLLALLKLVSRIAHRIAPQSALDFGTTEWSEFKAALAIRHRITHPKSESDLMVSQADIAISRAAFDWLFNLALSAMDAVLTEQRNYLNQLDAVVKDLKGGESTTLATYRTLQAERDAEH